ncbi:DNA adenine methylase [Vibrio parahaemolyticus]|uniref:DNA adenine methylase n=1 Tax=Vibrio parahaemolyticus TaxID=670 RepID=UPI0035BFC238|nr:DNA adenine methylase [Vibrio parahaemolyticus]MCF9577540.1 DNA adenine methylase [Vibrio parahaemolyticus]MCF9578676.1 DNA adenine methylase [Vibrio parahaemolyticus]MCF9624974.1 DNA adenine methylase [Vibrio parahaemolyticus]MCF9636154.1 DNA adenine methylase [Vibrio parahaemolyticus]
MKSIGYMGSKEKLLTFIEDAMRHYFGEKYKEINTFFDCFSGSGRVANHFKNQFCVTTNDKQFFTKVINNAFLNNKHSSEHFKPLIDHLNNLDEEYFYKTDGFFTQTYSMNHNVNGTLHEDGTRKLFLTKNGRKIDMIRHRIDEMFDSGEIDQEEKDVLIVCLMRAISLVQNAGGHQNSYYSEWKDKAFKDLVLTYPTIEPSVNTHIHFNADIEDVIENVESDVIYIDPPYGSTVPYSAYYHLYNTVAANSRPQVSMMASKPVNCYGKSKLEKNKKNEVMKSFVDLISASKSKTVVLSYHDEGLLSHSDLVKVMELSGCDISSLKTYGTNHRANLQSLSASKENGQKLRSVVEYVMIVNKARFSVVRSSAEVKEEIAKHLSLCIESDFEEIAYVYDKQSNSFETPVVKALDGTKKETIKQPKNKEKNMAYSIRKVKNKLQGNEQFRDELLSMVDESIPIIDKKFPYSNLQSQSDYIKEMLNGKTQFSGHFVSMYIHELKDIQKDLMCIDEIYVAFQSEPYNKRAIKNLQLINAGLCVLDYSLTHNVSLSEAFIEMKLRNVA